MNSNFRRGGLFLLPAVILAIVLAVVLGAPAPALVSIGATGFITTIILILLGDKRQSPTTHE